MTPTGTRRFGEAQTRPRSSRWKVSTYVFFFFLATTAAPGYDPVSLPPLNCAWSDTHTHGRDAEGQIAETEMKKLTQKPSRLSGDGMDVIWSSGRGSRPPAIYPLRHQEGAAHAVRRLDATRPLLGARVPGLRHHRCRYSIHRQRSRRSGVAVVAQGMCAPAARRTRRWATLK